MSARLLARLAVPLAAAFILGACSSQPDSTVPACPRVAIVADAAKLTQFRPGSGRDVIDVDYEARMSNVTGECSYDRRRTRVDVDMAFALEAARGAAALSRSADIGYFVAIVGPNEQVVAREEFRARLDFAGPAPRVGSREELQQRIPLTEGRAGADYQVLIGFLLTRDQLEYNRLLVR